MNVLLIIPPLVQAPIYYYNLPMGMLYVASYLRQGYVVEILNLNESPMNEHERIIKYRVKSAHAVMIGGLSVHYNIIKHIVGLVRKYSDAQIILGGGIVTSQPEIIADNIDADAYIVGEVEKFDFCYLPSGINYTNHYVDSKTLDRIMPAYDLFNMELYLGIQRPSDGHYRSIVDNPRDGAIIASRGCPYNCTFCFHPTGDKYRQRSLSSVFSEIEFLKETYAINIISIYDELFAHDKKRLTKFCERIKKLNLYWSCQLRVDSVDEDDLKMMKDARCYIISFGIESASDIILRSYKKNTKVSQINKALEATKKVGIAVQGNILYGAEDETIETIVESFNWWDKHREYKLAITPVIPYPGTTMYHNAVKKGLIDPVKFLESGCPAVNCSTLNVGELTVVNEMLSELMKDDKGIAKLYDEQTTGIDSWGRLVVNYKIKCPYCGQIDGRKNYAIESITQGIYFCRTCFMRFNVIK